MSVENNKGEMDKVMYLLKLMCYHRPLGKDTDKNLTLIEKKFLEKFVDEQVTMEQIKSMINEYYDMDGLAVLDAKDDEIIDNSEQLGEYSEKAVEQDNTTVAEGNGERLPEKEDESVNKKHNKHVTIDEEKNKIFDEITTDAKIQETASNEELDNDTATSKITNATEESEETIAGITEEKDDINKTHVMIETDHSLKAAENNDTKTPQKDQNIDTKAEKQEDEVNEEPAHLTRSQARKLQIDIEKEVQQNENNVQNLDESKQSKTTTGKNEDVEDYESDNEGDNKTAVEQDVGTDKESNIDINNSIAIHSETDDKTEEETSTPKKRGRKSKNEKIDEITPRRSTRLRRRSDVDAEVDETENIEAETTVDSIGRRTRSNSNGRNNQSQSDDEHESTAPVSRRGRKRKSVTSTDSELHVRRTRSKKREDDINVEQENEEDKGAKEAKPDKEDQNVKENPNYKERNKDEETQADDEGEGEDGEGDGEGEGEDGDGEEEEAEGLRLRRSSRKRKTERMSTGEEATSTPNSKKQKIEVATNVPAPRRRGRQPRTSPTPASVTEMTSNPPSENEISNVEAENDQGNTSTRRTRRR